MSNNQCKNLNDIIIESDLVLENLNNIIDSHSDEQSTVNTHQNETKNFVQNFLKKSESFKKLTNFSSSNKKVSNREKLDSLSSTNIEKILSKKIDSDNSCPHLNSISKQDKIKSKSYFINSSESSSPIAPSNLRKFFFSNSSSNTISGTKTKKLTDSSRKNQQYSTSFVNTPKKKRSSLFNLFSFTKSSSNSSQNLSTKENAEVFCPVDYDNVFSDTESDVMSPKRPQSECVSNPEWFTNFKFFNNKKSYKLSDKQKNSNKLERSSLILVSSNENIPNETKLIKNNSIYCKGFSIPLNASYCPNSTPPLNNEKKLSIRLKYAEIKQIEDDFNDENQTLHQTETNRFETLENKYRNYNYNTQQQQQQKEVNLIDDEENRCCSPSPSILTLSLNNKCSTATKTLTQNFNSINFVDNLNSNMFSQQQNESKANIIKVMSNQKEADLNETHSNCNNNELSYKKKRFQQFQTQSLIDINVQQLAKVKNDQCLENLNSNTNKIMLADDSISSTTNTKSIQNPLFKMNGYQTIEEDTNHISKLKQSYSSSSTFLNNEPMFDLTIKLNSNSKPIFKSVKLRKGFKLRDILKPVFSESNINMDDYDFYQTSDTSEINKNSVDLNKPCDEYIGTELYLKNKNTFSENKKLSNIYLANEEIEGEKSNLTTTPTFSSITWQNYFGTKSYKNNKQKRNSCIAVMNDYNSTTNQTVHSPLKNSSSASITSSMQSNYTSFVSNNPVNSTTSSNGTERIGRGTRHFKRMGQIAGIFASYSNSKLPEMANPLNDLLNLYTKDLPKLPDELTIKTFDLRTLDIESDWNKFVGESFAQSLPIKKAKQQMAIWELFVTECSLIKSIKIVIDVFLNCLISLKINEQTSELFKDIEIKKLFSNITEVYNCNVTLWQQYLYPTLNNLINGTSLSLIIDPQFLIHTFSDFKNLFKPYEEYCLEQNNINDYFKKKTNENENLAKLITWAENHPLSSGRLKFSEYMIMPVQRITRYHILIENISQYTDDEAKREQFSLIKEIVNSLPNSINMKLGYIAQFNDISESIEKYEGIQGQNEEITEILSEFKKFDIKAPLPGCSKSSIRELIHQGPLRLKDIPKSVDVHCFLFTDMLLITQLKKTKKYKIIKPPVSTNRMIIKELTQTDKAFVCISLNDYNVPDSVYMFISNQSKKWIEFLELAKQKYLAEKQRFNEIKYTEKISPTNSFNSENLQKESLDLTNRSISIESNESNSSEKSDLDPERRDSSATLTENIQLESTVTTENVVKSPLVQKKLYKNQFGNGTRIFGGRLDRPRRNMTDPNQHCNEIIDKNSITKRNSLNDRPGNMKPSLIAQTKLNFFAESTSTILSTDSGVSNCDNNQISFSQESITKNSPIKIVENVKNPSPSSPTSSSYSSSSNDPIYSNLSMSSSSSSNCSKYSETIKNHFKPQDEDFYEDEDLIENDEEDDDNTKTITADQITEHDNIQENNFIFKKIPNFRIKQPTSENIKMIKANFENLDLTKMENENFRNDNGNRITIRKPLIRIRPTNLKNEAIRLRSEQFICNNLNSSSNYDSTVDSAQVNLVNNYNLDNHHRMVLVNLLHTTLDSTEV